MTVRGGARPPSWVSETLARQRPRLPAQRIASRSELVGYEAPEWYFLAIRPNPLEAYNQGVSILIDQYVYGIIGWPNIVENVSTEQMQSGLMVSDRLGGDVPIYLSEWATPVVLLLWLVVPILLGYRRFERADLN